MAIGPEYASLPPGWSINGLFDDGLSDPLNFGLEENAVSALSALFTSLSILLVTDLTVRLIVRSRPSLASSHAVYRRTLFNHVANPLEGICALLWRSPAKKEDASGEDEHEPSHTTKQGASLQSVPYWQRGLISAAGLTLLVVQVALIFLATTRTSAVAVDKTGFPAFNFTEREQPPVYLPPTQDCTESPLVTKPGFVSRGTAFQCGAITQSHEADRLSAGFATVLFGISQDQIYLAIRTDTLNYIYTQHLFVALENGTQYVTRSPATYTDALRIVPRVLARYNLSVIGKYGGDELLNASTASWRAGYILNITDTRVPDVVMHEVQKIEDIETVMESAESSLMALAWNFYLSGVGRSALALTARTRAHAFDPTTGPFLDEYDGALVERQRPWLSVGGCLILCGSALTVWLFVACGVGWGSGVDERVAWVQVFKTVSHVSEFELRPDEIVEVKLR